MVASFSSNFNKNNGLGLWHGSCSYCNRNRPPWRGQTKEGVMVKFWSAMEMTVICAAIALQFMMVAALATAHLVA